MPAKPLLRRRGVAGRRRGHEVRNAQTRLSPREETTYKAHSSHWAAGGGGVIDAGESAVGIGVVFAGRSGLLPEKAPVTPLSLDACFRRLRNGVILLRVLSTSTVAGVSTSCCWALASGVSVGRGDSAIAGCPLRSQPPPPMQARHCANICPGGRTPSVFGHAVSSITPGGRPVPYLACSLKSSRARGMLERPVRRREGSSSGTRHCRASAVLES